MDDLAIITSSATASGALALRDAATRQGYDVVVAVIGKDDIVETLRTASQAIFRVGPKSYSYYVDILDQVPQKYNLAIRAMLRGFDKGATYQVLASSQIAMPATALLKRGEEPASYPAVMKILNGNQGIGVELIKDKAEHSRFEQAYSNEKMFLCQEFIAEAGKQDKRLLIVSDQCVAAMKRRSVSDDFRANLHTGGTAEAYNPTPEEVALAIRTTKAFDLPYAGVDIIDSKRGPLILEINPSPGLAISEVTGIDVAAKIIEGVMK